MKFFKFTALFLVLTMMSCEKESVTTDSPVSEIDAAQIEDFLERNDLIGVKELRIGDEVYFTDKIRDPRVLDKIEAMAQTDGLLEEVLGDGISRLSVPVDNLLKRRLPKNEVLVTYFSDNKLRKSIRIKKNKPGKRLRNGTAGPRQIWVWKNKGGKIETLIKRPNAKRGRRFVAGTFGRNKALNAKYLTSANFRNVGKRGIFKAIRYIN